MNAPSPPQAVAAPAERRLTLQEVLSDMVADNLVSKEAAAKLIADRRHSKADVHPLIVIAGQKWKDPRTAKKSLHLEALTEWLAEKVGLPYLHIDPFKIDFAAVTKVMSNAYAERYKILPVGVTGREATIAVCEPQ